MMACYTYLLTDYCLLLTTYYAYADSLTTARLDDGSNEATDGERVLALELP